MEKLVDMYLLNSANPVNIKVVVYASVERVLLASTLQSSRSRLSDGWFTGVGYHHAMVREIGLLVSISSLELTASDIAFSLSIII